ncbi:MAG: 16S rRNA (adenine(1518)-N(6)/adenine(1519)-N(6))-dimethyltransferase RsmA [Actinomycetes bacterium]
MLGPAEVRELLERRGLSARRSLGQNFVADPTVVEWIADVAAVGVGDAVLEVGPGLGSLTLALAATGAHVLAVEKDAGLVPVLNDVLAASGVTTGVGPGQVEVHRADALEVSWPELLRGSDQWTLVANLPYNVAVPVVLSMLEDAPMVHHLVVMVQREVAERLAADPGGRTIGMPSLRTAWYASSEILGDVGPESFVPAPRVVSSVISLRRRPAPSTELRADEVLRLADTAYRQRRKMLRSTLGHEVSAAVFARAGIDPTARPETLSITDWTRLAEMLRTAEVSP